jgi:hypothetical protein
MNNPRHGRNQACPKEIPLTESIAEVNRQAWKLALLGWLMG